MSTQPFASSAPQYRRYESPKPRLTPRQVLRVGFAAVTLALGAHFAFGGGGGGESLDDQIAQLPTSPAIIPAGGGALDAISAVDPQVVAMAWKDPAAKRELGVLVRDVNKQAPYGDGIPQAGQQVNVPDVPEAGL